MTKTIRALLALTLLLAGSALPSLAQGVQTGSLAGTVQDQGAQPLPGVAVTVTSPALQGSRTTVTDGNGVYSLAGLPPGLYAVRFELSGMRTVDATQRVDLGQMARVGAVLKVAVVESVQVTAAAPSIVTSTQGGANMRADDINKLASIRTVWGIAELAPNVTDNTPNAGQLAIAGGFAYSNQFLINGVDVADNIFATPNSLFIEDALEEVQVLSSGVSAEFGRFGGGVVNAITKSGGNTFSGSGRLNFYSPSWTKETPFETAAGITRQKDVQNNYEGTFGGPLVKDRLWFFTAGRYQSASTPAPLPETAIPFTTENTNKRAEFKLTGTVSPNHTLQGSFTNNRTSAHQGPVAGVIDLASMVNRPRPEHAVGHVLPRRPARVHAGLAAGVGPALRHAQRRRHRDGHLQLALPHARRVARRPDRPLLQRAVPGLQRPGRSGQSPGHGLAELDAHVAGPRQPRPEGGLRELREPVRRRQFADSHRLRVPRRLCHGERPSRARRTGPRVAGVHARRDPARELAAAAWLEAGDHHQLGLRAGPLGRRAAAVARPRHAVRDGRQPRLCR